MAETIKSRIERVETEMRFRIWVRYHRFLESLSVDELKIMARTGQFPERPEPGPGMSPFDNMGREELQKRWKEDEQHWAFRNRQELGFFGLHGHWPEQGCGTNCRKRRDNEREIQIHSGGCNVLPKEKWRSL